MGSVYICRGGKRTNASDELHDAQEAWSAIQSDDLGRSRVSVIDFITVQYSGID